jgi:hypothetical protein
MLYDIFIVVLGSVGIGMSLWASLQINKAAKEGKIRFFGKVRIGRQRQDRLANRKP